MEDRRVDFSTYAKVLIKRRWLIFYNCAAVVGIVIVISLILPYSFTATVTLFPPQQEFGIEGMAAQLAGIAGLGQVAGALGLPGMATTTDLYAALVLSRTVGKGVISSMNLMEIWDEEMLETALKHLWRVTEIDATPEGILVVSVTDRDPERAAAIAMAYVAELDKLNREANMTKAGRQREFTEGRLEETKSALTAAEESLRVFQERHGVFSIEEEVVVAINAAARLKGEIMARDVQLRVLEEFAAPENPELLRVKSELQQLERELEMLEREPRAARREGGRSEAYVGTGVGFSVPFAEVPEVGLELGRRLREVEIQQTVFALLTQQYEAAKIAEARDTPTIQVLDEAEPPERRSFPQRKKMVLIAGFLTLAFSLIVSFLLEFAENVRERPQEEREWRWMSDQLRNDMDRVLPWRRRRRRSNIQRE